MSALRPFKKIPGVTYPTAKMWAGIPGVVYPEQHRGKSIRKIKTQELVRAKRVKDKRSAIDSAVAAYWNAAPEKGKTLAALARACKIGESAAAYSLDRQNLRKLKGSKANGRRRVFR